jgi:hypothetical protein
MASGHVNRINRPNTWLHMALFGHGAMSDLSPLCAAKQTCTTPTGPSLACGNFSAD